MDPVRENPLVARRIRSEAELVVSMPKAGTGQDANIL